MRMPLEARISKKGSLMLYRLFFALACLWTLAILGFSLLSRQVSADQSSWLKELLLYWTGLDINAYFLRKLAHFAEYLLLGLLSAGALAQTSWAWKQAGMLSGGGFLLAFLDETLQIFSGRGPAIADVWLDLFGFLVGLALSLLFFSLLQDIRARKSPQ